MRSLEPCYLTIGGITVMSLQNFSSVRKIWLFHLPLKILNTNNFYNLWNEFPDPASIGLVFHRFTIVSIKWKFLFEISKTFVMKLLRVFFNEWTFPILNVVIGFAVTNFIT